MFILRCRKLKEIRDIGLKYVVFFPKFVLWSETSNLRQWELLKNEIRTKSLLDEVDKAVEIHCPNWLERLQNQYPHRSVSLPAAQPLRDALSTSQGNMNLEKCVLFRFTDANLFPA
jgi:hypothetical protein